MRNLVARSDQCGRVWIEDAEHGRFPPHGFYLSFPQQLTKSGKPHKGNTAKMLAFARKMAAVEETERQRDLLLMALRWGLERHGYLYFEEVIAECEGGGDAHQD